MGEGITIECKSCDYKKSFTLGVGMMYASLENVISQVSPKRREDVLNIIHNEEVYEVNYQHKLFFCSHCHNLESRFDYFILYNNNKKYKPIFCCPECRKKLIPVEEPIENIPCPKCGKKALTKFVSMMWD